MSLLELPNFAGQAEFLRAKLAAKKKEEYQKSRQIKKCLKGQKHIVCDGCGEQIEDEFFYKCIFHAKAFCESCAKNEGKDEIDYKQAKVCIIRGLNKYECIYSKILNPYA